MHKGRGVGFFQRFHQKKKNKFRGDKTDAWRVPLVARRVENVAFFLIRARNDLRAFRWGTATFHPNATNLHPTAPFANKVSEREYAAMVHLAPDIPRPRLKTKSVREEDSSLCAHSSLAKTRARQDAGRSLRDAGAPREEFPCRRGFCAGRLTIKAAGSESCSVPKLRMRCKFMARSASNALRRAESVRSPTTRRARMWLI